VVRVVHETSQQQGVPPPLIRSVKVIHNHHPTRRSSGVCAAAAPEVRLGCGPRRLQRAHEGAGRRFSRAERWTAPRGR